MKVYKHGGVLLELGHEIGRGGEGAVHEIPDNPNLVAKIYKTKYRQERRDKIEGMVKSQSDALAKFVAWPAVSLFSDKARSDFVGFCMPRVPDDYYPAHRVYSPADRRVLLPNVDWRFLFAAAANTCRAIGEIHLAGHVIGDLNQSNIRISPRALVRIVDADSIQFRSANRVFRCTVGVPEFTPPELQGKRLESVDRTSNHDLFGLAVLVFHLIFMGRHPFSGTHSTPITLAEAIARGFFVYSPRVGSTCGKPPGSLPLDTAGPGLARLFERAFAHASSATPPARPTSIEWCNALESVKSALRKCPNAKTHFFVPSAGPCPWCEFAVEGIEFFPADAAVVLASVANRGADISRQGVERLWNQIRSIPRRPGFDESVLQKQFSPVSLPEFKPPIQLDSFLGAMGCAAVIAISIIPILAVACVILGIGAVVVNAMAKSSFDSRRENLELTKRRSQQTQLLGSVTRVLEKIKAAREAHEYSWNSKHGSLEKAKNALEFTPVGQQELAAKAHAVLGTKQEEDYLRRHLISEARISGIGPSIVAELRSFGFETAYDVLQVGQAAAPGSQATASPPSCPRCGSRMVKKLARRGPHAGHHFWGCSRYPSCSAIVNIGGPTQRGTGSSAASPLQRVPGIGPVRDKDLAGWAKATQTRFRPSISDSELRREVERIRREVFREAENHWRTLESGPADLSALNVRFNGEVQPLLRELQQLEGQWMGR